MKKYISFIAILLCSLVVNVTAANNQKNSDPTAYNCCKKCKDKKCIELCKQYDALSAEAKSGEEGKKIKDECMQLCKEKKCCSTDGVACCETTMDGKACCKKK
jgi:hypothetical protein